jgi:hypothetical protein
MVTEIKRRPRNWFVEWDDTTNPHRRHSKTIEVEESDVVATVEKGNSHLECSCGFKSEKENFRQTKLHLYIEHHIPMRALKDFVEKLAENEKAVSVRWKRDS